MCVWEKERRRNRQHFLWLFYLLRNCVSTNILLLQVSTQQNSPLACYLLSAAVNWYWNAPNYAPLMDDHSCEHFGSWCFQLRCKYLLQVTHEHELQVSNVNFLYRDIWKKLIVITDVVSTLLYLHCYIIFISEPYYFRLHLNRSMFFLFLFVYWHCCYSCWCIKFTYMRRWIANFKGWWHFLKCAKILPLTSQFLIVWVIWRPSQFKKSVGSKRAHEWVRASH